jgi:hypothetical protein
VLSTLTEEDLKDMEVRGILPEKAISEWRCCYREEFPTEDQTKMVLFWSFYEKGFGLPARAFFRWLLHFYSLKVIHLKQNSIVQIAIFIHIYKGYLGIAAHFNLWRALYHLRVYPSKEKPIMVGGATFSLRQVGEVPRCDPQE